MTREECEKQILRKMQDINEIIKRYNPDNTYFTAGITDGVISFWNSYWDNKDENKISYSSIIDGGKYD